MALPPLATAADLDDFGFQPVDASFLLRASTRVRRYTGQQITAGTSTVTLTTTPYRLPQRPVTEVVSVTKPDDDTELDFELRAAGVIRLVRSWYCGPIEVEWHHGFVDLPDALVELVCSIASRMANTPDAVHAGARTEQAGGESVTWGAESYAGTSGLTQAEEDELDRLFPKLPSTIRLR